MDYTPEEEKALDEIKTRLGVKNLVTLRNFEDNLLAFRPLKQPTLIDVAKKIEKDPSAELTIGTNACRLSCVYGKEHFDELVETHAGVAAQIFPQLLEQARGIGFVTVSTY